MARVKPFIDLVSILMLTVSYESVLSADPIDTKVKTAIEDDILKLSITSVFPIVILLFNADGWLQS